MDNFQLKQFMEKWIDNNRQEFFDLADDIWANPELGLEEYYSSAAIIKVLEKHGFTVQKGVGGMPTAFIAQWGEKGPVAGFSVEYDALPDLSQDKNSAVHLPLKEGAPGHGCGHNILGTGAVMAGIALKNVLEYSGVPGIVRLYGTPYEEASVGKPLLVKAGAFENLDFVLDWHPHGGNYAYYEVCNSVFVLNFTFKGKKSHGARPVAWKKCV